MKRLLGLSILLLAFVFVFTGCDSNGDSDSWSSVVSVEHLNGSWQGSYSQDMPIKDYMETYEGGWDPSLQIVYGDMNVISTVDINTTINSDIMRQTGTVRVTERFSGGNISTLWPFFKQGFEAMGTQVQVNDDNYSMSVIQVINQTVSLADFAGLEINQNYNKVRFRASEFEFVGNDYIVLNKQ